MMEKKSTYYQKIESKIFVDGIKFYQLVETTIIIIGNYATHSLSKYPENYLLKFNEIHQMMYTFFLCDELHSISRILLNLLFCFKCPESQNLLFYKPEHCKGNCTDHWLLFSKAIFKVYLKYHTKGKGNCSIVDMLLM